MNITKVEHEFQWDYILVISRVWQLEAKVLPLDVDKTEQWRLIYGSNRVISSCIEKFSRQSYEKEIQSLWYERVKLKRRVQRWKDLKQWGINLENLRVRLDDIKKRVMEIAIKLSRYSCHKRRYWALWSRLDYHLESYGWPKLNVSKWNPLTYDTYKKLCKLVAIKVHPDDHKVLLIFESKRSN